MPSRTPITLLFCSFQLCRTVSAISAANEYFVSIALRLHYHHPAAAGLFLSIVPRSPPYPPAPFVLFVSIAFQSLPYTLLFVGCCDCATLSPYLPALIVLFVSIALCRYPYNTAQSFGYCLFAHLLPPRSRPIPVHRLFVFSRCFVV